MPIGTANILDVRSLENDYSTLLPLLKRGLRVLDVGCGTGAIARGIAEAVGKDGYVVGIDNSEHLINKGIEGFGHIPNLQLMQVDLFKYRPEEKFDLIVVARVLQWLNNPQEALTLFKGWLKPGAQVSVLDYNHRGIEWYPEPPYSMRGFYQTFLDWRTDAGMNNEMAEHLAEIFETLNFYDVDVIDANEVYQKSAGNFQAKAGIWAEVAKTRGKQMVEDGYISEEFRIQVVTEYSEWIKEDAEQMIMKLKDVRGRA